MEKDKIQNMLENEPVETDNNSKEIHYNFEKNIFIVEPVFKENSADTLGTVLLRLINSGG